MMNQYHTIMAPHVECEEGSEVGPMELFLQLWFIKTPCCFHDAHNGFKWALLAQQTSGQLMDEVYIGIASCCNSAGQLLNQQAVWGQ